MALKQACRYDFDTLINLAKLTPRQREIITMKYIDDMKNYQIAMELNVSPETVRNDLADASDQLNRAIKVLAQSYIR